MLYRPSIGKTIAILLPKQGWVSWQCLLGIWMGDPWPNPPRFCSCSSRNSLNQNCKNGGYANYRHDNVRNAIAEYLRQICKDVTIEPHLIPIESEKFQQKGNNADKARLDVAARGLWSTFERTLADVRIFNPNSESYLAQTLAQLCIQQDNKKGSISI